MKSRVQISRLAVVCVMCASAVSGAFGAASVRSLGGAGTYSSASSAAGGAPSGAVSAARAGSMRVSASGGMGGSVAPNRGTTTTGRVATAPRLSIGKYLGGGTSVSGGSSIKNQKPGGSTSSSSGGGSMDPGVMADLESRVGELEGQVANIYVKDDVDSILQDKQNVLTPVDDYIEIENDEIYLNVDALQEGLETITGKDGREVEIGSNATHLLWRYKGDTAWQELIALADITGPQGPAGEKGEKGDPGEGLDPEQYPTKEFMNAEIARAIDSANYVTPEALSEAIAGFVTRTAVAESIADATSGLASKEELAGCAKTADVYTKDQVYTKGEVDTKVADVVAGDMSEALAAYAKTADVNSALEKKADVSALSDYATNAVVTGLTGRVSAVETEMDDINELAVNAATDAATAVTSATAAKTAADEATAAAGVALTTANSASGAADAAKTMAEGAKTSADTAVATAGAAKTAADAATAGLALKANADDVYTKTAADEKFALKANTYTKTEVDTKVAEISAGNMDEALKAYAKTEYVDAELAKKANTDSLGALALKNTISNADVADDAAIAKTKLSADVQASLSKADQAVSIADAPETGDFVLAISDGQKGWFEVVTE